jgi:hypothetical protein
MDAPPAVKIFLSWAHEDKHTKDALLAILRPTLRLIRDVRIEWWQDSDLTPGEELLPAIAGRLDEADYGLLLLSNAYFDSIFIRDHELPRFAGPDADKGSLPVLLRPLPGFGPEWNLMGVERQIVFTRDGLSFEQTTGPRRTLFANELAAAIRRRILGLNGYSHR